MRTSRLSILLFAGSGWAASWEPRSQWVVTVAGFQLGVRGLATLDVNGDGRAEVFAAPYHGNYWQEWTRDGHFRQSWSSFPEEKVLVDLTALDTPAGPLVALLFEDSIRLVNASNKKPIAEFPTTSNQNKAFAVAEAFAVKDTRFVAVGRNAEIRALAGPRTQQVDLRGQTVIPGLMDNHLHGAGGGPGIDLSRARSLDDVYAAIRDRVARVPAGEVVVSNSDWHEAQLKEQRLPLRDDLDRVAPAHPVVLVRGGHEYILNSAALAKWGIDEKTAEPEGGRLTRFADGRLQQQRLELRPGDRSAEEVALPQPAAQAAQDPQLLGCLDPLRDDRQPE